jgi:YHS domain-containing protein
LRPLRLAHLHEERTVHKIKTLILALALVAFVGGSLWAADAKPQTKCPVLGGNVNKQVYADYKGKRVYFCCEGCDKEFNKDPEKYMKKLHDAGVTPEATPAGAAKK